MWLKTWMAKIASRLIVIMVCFGFCTFFSYPIMVMAKSSTKTETQYSNNQHSNSQHSHSNHNNHNSHKTSKTTSHKNDHKTESNKVASKAEKEPDPEKNLEDGNKFLASNSKKSGIVTLPSGLQYKIIKPGKGTPPALHNLVKVQYRGTLLNGKEFDNSERHKSSKFAVDTVILGWREALQMMKPGAEWIIYVPAKLGYGKKGVKGIIPPNSTLIFNLKLLSVEGSAEEAAQEDDSPVLPDYPDRESN